MKIFVSGVNQCDYEAYFGPHGECSFVWHEKKDFLDSLTSRKDSGEPFNGVWLYRAPWALVLDQPLSAGNSESVLNNWLESQRLLLNYRREFGDSLVLVNIDRINPINLLMRLGISGAEEQVLLPFINNAGMDVNIAAKIFDWIAPLFWDVFESLESMAWLPDGDPYFRSTIKVTGDSRFFEIIDILRAGMNASQREALLTQKDQRCAQLIQDLEASSKSQSDRDVLWQENESLLIQLHLVQERLELTLSETDAKLAAYQQSHMALTDQNSKNSIELNAVRQLLTGSEERCAQLIQDLDASRKSQSDRDALRQENESLLIQLHHAQERLNLTLSETDAKLAAYQQSHKALTDQNSIELNAVRQLLTGSEERCAQLIQDLDASRKSQSDRDVLINENEALISQLHLAQEVIEKYTVKTQTDNESHKLNNEINSVSANLSKAPIRGGRYDRFGFLPNLLGQFLKPTKSESKLLIECQLIEKSGLFDRDWYLIKYPDVANSPLLTDPIKHYIKFGWKEMRDPSAIFSTIDYLNRYPDVNNGLINPLIHYIKFGANEGREYRSSSL